MTGLLRWAAISSVGIILLECARGVFVGQRHLGALLVLSLLVGLGMVTLLPTMAHRHDPKAMLVAQGLVAIAAVLLCILLGRKLGLRLPANGVRALPLGADAAGSLGFRRDSTGKPDRQQHLGVVVDGGCGAERCEPGAGELSHDCEPVCATWWRWRRRCSRRVAMR